MRSHEEQNPGVLLYSLNFIRFDVFGDLSVQSPADLAPVLDWFEDMYIGRPTRQGSRREPKFPPQMWSVHNRTLMGHDRTNNFVEAAHRQMRAEFGGLHSTLWRFIDATRSVQAGRDQHADLYFRGEEPPGRRRRVIRCAERLQRIAQQFDRRSH
uniref:DDE domain-containing protein n=1 Tax=Trichuris muris TaxID=70415 RepID=A0A5S6R5Z4_TRIMR